MRYTENRLSAIWNGAVLYRMEKGRWPADDGELLLFASLKNLDLDVDGFEYLSWEEGSSGELIISFILKPCGDDARSGLVRVRMVGEGLALESVPVTVRIHYTPENPRRYCAWPGCTVGANEQSEAMARAS
jgi:hypothetical protein